MILIVILLISIGILAFYFIPVRITPKVPLTSEDISIKVERTSGNTGPVFKVGEYETITIFIAFIAALASAFMLIIIFLDRWVRKIIKAIKN